MVTDMTRSDPAAVLARLFTGSVEDDAGCWNYAASVGSSGYGQICVDYKRWSAHRLAWTLLRGRIAPGLFVCHRCDNKRCIRPAHLFLGTATDNNRDMTAKGRNRNVNMGRTHCRRGHEFAAGSYYVNKRGSRCCLVCDRLKHKAKYRGERVPSVWGRT